MEIVLLILEIFLVITFYQFSELENFLQKKKKKKEKTFFPESQDYLQKDKIQRGTQ